MAAMRVAQVSGLPCPRHLARCETQPGWRCSSAAPTAPRTARPGPTPRGAARRCAAGHDRRQPAGAGRGSRRDGGRAGRRPRRELVAPPTASRRGLRDSRPASRPRSTAPTTSPSYPAAQQLAPGAALGADGAAIAWDRTRPLHHGAPRTRSSSAYEPLHIYLEAGTALARRVAVDRQGVQRARPAAAVHADRADRGAPRHRRRHRRRTTACSSPDGGWTTRATPLAPGTDVFASADERTLSVAVPWTALGGCPTALRLAVHVVHASAGNEWKELSRRRTRRGRRRRRLLRDRSHRRTGRQRLGAEVITRASRAGTTRSSRTR